MFIIFEREMAIGNYKHDRRLAISGKVSSRMCKYQINCRFILIFDSFNIIMT